MEISGFSIRALSDPDFAAYLDAVALETARETGRQIRRWHEERGMSLDDLASAAGLDADTIARVEAGTTDVSFPTQRQVLAPLGHTLKELALTLADDDVESSAEQDQ